MARLFIFAGLPGTGKSALSKRLAQKINAVHLRIDTIEQALRDLCHLELEGEGYRIAYRIAADNLRLGRNVVADSCNPIELTRAEWETVAKDTDSRFVNIELICSDRREHRRRIESRSSEIPGLKLPTWSEVVKREYHSWSRDRIVIDTAEQSEDQCLETLMLGLASMSGRISDEAIQ
jgi:predicted kinase